MKTREDILKERDREIDRLRFQHKELLISRAEMEMLEAETNRKCVKFLMNGVEHMVVLLNE